MPGSEFFEAMMEFASSTAGFRERWWQGMADAAHYARKDYMCGDPCYDPCAPHSSYCDPCAPHRSYCDPCCDPCAPHPSYCDPCAPPWSYCDPCAPKHGRRGYGDEPDSIDLKALRSSLEIATHLKLAPKLKNVEELETRVSSFDGNQDSPELAELKKQLTQLKTELATEKARAGAELDAVIHAVKLSRVAEAMRRKQWSRESSYQRRC